MVTDSFSGRQILFIGIGFYDYELCIVEELRRKGANVVSFVDRPWILRQSFLAKLCRQLSWVYRWLIRHHEQHIIKGTQRYNFDQVLIIKSTDLSVCFLCRLKKNQPKAQFILYLWDSLSRLEGISHRLPYFDRVLTFDRIDAEGNTALVFRPLFYRHAENGALVNSSDLEFDISFVGWLHSQRLEAVRIMEVQAEKLGLKMFIYLYTGFFTWTRLALRGEARGVHFLTLPYHRLIEINRNSKCIFDFPHPGQNGLTMRAIEALGLRKKLITTGGDVVNYNFYSAANIHKVDFKNFEIDKNFIYRPAQIITKDVIQQYSLDAWISDVLNWKFRAKSMS